jgi:hypothetical protein
MKHFAVYSPVLGKREDIPNILLNKAFTPDSKNCQYWSGKVRTIYGRTPELIDASGEAVGVPESTDASGEALGVSEYNPVIKSVWHQSDTGSKHLLVFTATNAYRWVQATRSWTTMFASAGTVKTWSVVSFNGKVIATNNVDAPIIWSGSTSDTFEALGAAIAEGITISKAKVVDAFENHIIFGNYSISTGDSYENGIIWSDLDDETEWQSGDAGAAYVEGKGVVWAFGRKNDFLYVFKTHSSRMYWYTATEFIFSSRPYMNEVGTFSPDSIGNDRDGNLYFFGSDLAFREVDVGIISNAIKDTVRTINHDDDVIYKIQYGYIAEYDEVWWACPVGSSITNNTVWCYIKDGIWYERTYAVSCFGQYQVASSENYTWDDQPEGIWDDWTGVWNDAVETAGWILDLCFDYYGYTYTSHSSSRDTAYNGSAMVSGGLTYYFTLSVDMADKQGLRYFKRLLRLFGYFTSIHGEPVSIYIKRDNEPAWQSAGTMETTSAAAIHIENLPVDYRSRHFLIKIQSITPFEFLGMEMDYLLSGER